jgi:hypothetical protein
VRGVALVIAMGSVLSLCLSTKPSHASIYSPDDTSFNVQVGPNGKAQVFDFEKRFKPLILRLTNLVDERKIDGNDVNGDRQAYLKLIKEYEKKRNPSAEDVAAHAGYLLRIGDLDKALNLLIPRRNDPRPSYFVFVTLGHIYATRGGDDWRDALQYHQEGLLDSAMPPTVKGITAAEREWLNELDTYCIPHYYRISKREAEIRKGKSQLELDKLLEAEEVLPLFPIPRAKEPVAPVRFVNDAGVYQPGQLAAAEKAKLPEDAIAIVQQLVLWFPRDARLYWLLAELYAANGHYSNAAYLFDRCSGALQFSKRKIMMDHRAAVRTVADKDQSGGDVALTQNSTDTSVDTPQVEPPISMKTIWYYFGAIGLVAVFAVVRGISRRSKQKTAT